MASKRRIFGSLAVLCQHISDDVIQCFVDHCLADPFHRLSAVNASDEGNMLLCESVFTGLGEVAQLPRDSVSETVYSVLTGSALMAIYQLLPLHYQVCLIHCLDTLVCREFQVMMMMIVDQLCSPALTAKNSHEHADDSI